MTCPAILIILAAAIASEPPLEASAALGVTATVIRPVEISSPSVRSERALVTIRNVVGVEVLATGARIDTSDPGTAILTGEGAEPMDITLVY